MVPAWATDWVGIPYVERGRSRDGCDCMGLVIMLHQERFGVALPDPYCTITAAIRRDIVRQTRALYDEVSSPREGDVLHLRVRGMPLHVGYVVDECTMLHSERDVGSVAEPWNGTKWRNRVIGIYRYAGRTS